jgi:hypothetical protein
VDAVDAFLQGIVRVLREQLHLQADELCKRELEAQLLHVQLQAAVERATEAAQQLVQLEQHVASLRAAANPDTVMQLEIWRLQREVQAHKLRVRDSVPQKALPGCLCLPYLKEEWPGHACC